MKFRRRTLDEMLDLRRDPIPAEILDRARGIIDRVHTEGESALRDYAARLDGLPADATLFYTREHLDRLLADSSTPVVDRLERISERIRRFSGAQRSTMQSLTTQIPGGLAGHDIVPVERAGCYAPGGRYPLPSSVLMTVIPAREAGVRSIWVASPNPAPVTLLAAAVAGADGLMAAGGAHAIAALAKGIGPVPSSDIVVGPGNLWVTAAKQILAGRVGIDLPAGPSELVVIADVTSDAELVASDLLAQAEHDTAARPILITRSEQLIERVQKAVEEQLVDLPSAETATAALLAGGAVLCDDDDEIIRASDAIAPEHLQLSVSDPEYFRTRLRHCGALFIGEGTAEVFGDYGAGPNHVLPTGGAARFSGGLSVLTFLRVRTWMKCDAKPPNQQLVDDTVWLARQEGLEAHARAAERRRAWGSLGPDIPRA